MTGAPWLAVPPTPPMPPADASGRAEVGGIAMHYAVHGSGAPVLLVHGGLAHGDVWGAQVAALRTGRTVIVADTRGHGRSGRGTGDLGYQLMASDYLDLLDHLGIARTALVGWSDGAIIGLDIAIRHPERLTRFFADGMNATAEGVDMAAARDPIFADFDARMAADYQRMSPTPDGWRALKRDVLGLWAREPAYSPGQLAAIPVPTAVVIGEHDRMIRRDHTDALAATIPGARKVVLPGVSHFGLLQDSARYNAAMLAFLED